MSSISSHLIHYYLSVPLVRPFLLLLLLTRQCTETHWPSPKIPTHPPPKYKASQCGESDPNTASQSDSSKDCTHSKGVNQLGAMSHSEPAALFLDVVIDVELFTLRANFLSPANFALFPLVNFVSSAGQLSLRQLFAPAWKCVDHCDTNTKRNKFLYKYKYSWKHIGPTKGVALIRGYPLHCADTNRQSPMHLDTSRPH